ncbi:lipase [Steroidobacter agaridevorans]|uniref:Lipase n=1 Tax=Steroidobacter agaridevorans TaxID=2695856 RepID=A0A829YHU8_9GAMM|nr:alpha/beta hydrolase [Steroidobacter agaridevorans]GFE82401.1 lipase [Steroidobacter agaridevorans]
MNQPETSSKVWRILKWTLTGTLGLIVLLVAAALLIANSQDGSVKVLQTYLYSQWGREPNSFEPLSPPRDAVRSDGVRIRTNVKFGTEYPNSFLDIWYPTADDRVKRPTVIFMHGGGWFMGSKEMGDPLAAGSTESTSELSTLVAKEGFNFVNLDYALSPEYRYPVPMKQLNQALAYLQEHSEELGLDMTNVVIMGGSAGAQMTAQYGLLISNPAYAADVGIEPAIDASAVKALVIFAAPLKFSGFGWRMNAMLWAYLGTKDLEDSQQAKQVNILAHVNSQYPATYITDGNQPDTFPEHAKAMARLLRENDVEHVFNYYEPSEALLDHGYTGRLDTKQGRENLEKAIAFMKQRTGLASSLTTSASE